MEGFFSLIPNFQAQSEPNCCGFSSLSIVLNALHIDPERKSKGNSWISYLFLFFLLFFLDAIDTLNLSGKDGWLNLLMIVNVKSKIDKGISANY